MALTESEAKECVAKKDAATDGFFFQQTMLRVKDPKKSLKFYTEVLGMRLLHKIDMPSMKFSVYFLGYEAESEIPTDAKERTAWCFSKPATLELTHNWGSENDDTTYHNGNSEPRGFGHIGIGVPNLEEACERFEKMGVQFKKKPSDGTMDFIAFILDPDGYWIEIFAPKNMRI